MPRPQVELRVPLPNEHIEAGDGFPARSRGVEQETGLERRVDQIVGDAAALKWRRVGRFMFLGPGHAE